MKSYFKFACIYCGQHLECDTGLSGRQTKCPACHNRIVIPAEAKGQAPRNAPLTKFKWDTVVPEPDLQDPKVNAR